MSPFERRDMPYIIGVTIVVVILILAFRPLVLEQRAALTV
jgi:hypothetical protein